VNYIVAATYTDSLMQFPQAVWSRAVGADPTYANEWDPDYDAPYGQGPWLSACWQLVQARYVPAGVAQILFNGSNDLVPGFEETCEDPSNPGVPQHASIFRAYTSNGGRVIPQVDFDAVDVPCVCCD
jgi:hypothetical protein